MNPEQEVVPEFHIVCGYSARKLGWTPSELGPGGDSGNSWTSRWVSFIQALHQVHGFDTPPIELVADLPSLRELSRIIDAGASAVLEFDSLGDCVRAVAELETTGMILRRLDSPQFAIWCGAHQSSARGQLLSMIAEVESALHILRSATCSLHVVIAADPRSVKLTNKEIRKASLLGLSVDSVQMLWGSHVTAKRLNSWAEKLVSAGAGLVWLRSEGKPSRILELEKVDHAPGRVLKAGTLVELGPGEYLYVIDFPAAKKMDLRVGILDNHCVFELMGVRRYLQLPAACSRMQARNCTLSSTHIALYFTVQEDLWPTQ